MPIPKQTNFTGKITASEIIYSRIYSKKFLSKCEAIKH